jgi:uncharacterized membrane protein HdeD (DUF308 family)
MNYALPSNWKWAMAEGVVLTALGFFAITIPQYMTIGVTLIVGWMLILTGVFGLLRGFVSKDSSERMPAIVSIFITLMGLMVLYNPFAAVLSFTLLLILYIGVDGVYKIGSACRMRRGRPKTLVLVSGILSLILAVMLLSGWPSTAVWFLGMVFGLNLIFSGATLIALALEAKQA